MFSVLLCLFVSCLVVLTLCDDKVYPASCDVDNEAVATCDILIQTTAIDDTHESIEFEKFKSKHKRVYESEKEETYRYQVFLSALKRITARNDNRKERGAEQTQGITKFSDKTYEEFKKYLGFIPRERITVANTTTKAPVECPACENFLDTVNQAKANNAINWVTAGAVTAVKDQGVCGSCWAFSTVVDVEGTYYLKYKTLTSWSEEQLVQCDTVDSGCDGGMMEYGMEYIMAVDGLDSEAAYPYLYCTYKGSTYCLGYSSKCASFMSGIGLSVLGRVSSWYYISYNNALAEPEIKTALFTSGPLSCAINAYPMLDYTSGIDDPAGCGNSFSDLNHGVAFVGFGTTTSASGASPSGTSTSTPYWVIKNSWGSDWGVDGYYMIVYGSNACGLALYVVHSVIS